MSDKLIDLGSLSHYHDRLDTIFLTPLSNRANDIATDEDIDEALFGITKSSQGGE